MLILMVALTAVYLPQTAGAPVNGAETAAEALVEKGIICGDKNGDLQLEKSITRAEFAKMLCLAFETEIGENIDFTDVPEDYWAYSYIGGVSASGAVNGFEDGTFRPEEAVTYEQAVKMVMCLCGFSYGEYPIDFISNAINEGYLDNVEALSGEKISRGDAVTLIYNALAVESENSEELYNFNMNTMSGTGGGSSSASGGSMKTLQEESVYMQDASVMPYMPLYPEEYRLSEEYTQEDENVFHSSVLSPLSTFSIDVDTASYSNMRRFILNGEKPAAGSVRTEELINYFNYSNPQPAEGEIFGVVSEMAVCPWNDKNLLCRISLQGTDINETQRAPQNLVFLIDVSGSMYSRNKLPLVQRSAELLLSRLDARDTVSVVTYASGVKTVLDGVNASEKDKICKAIYGLRAGGGTGGSKGLEEAYKIAEKHKTEGNNRIILCTDGDFNIGPSSDAEMKKQIEQSRDKGIFISVLGFGMGNYKDAKMEIIADNGNGNYYYIDNLKEAKKVLADEMTKTLYTIAKDVKIQVEFNPAKVKEYRLIGYENRVLSAEDFDNDKKDAGEAGAGATVTVLYELVLSEDTAIEGENNAAEAFRYSSIITKDSNELMCVKLRYKQPNGEESVLREYPIEMSDAEQLGEDFSFAAAVAEFGMILNDSEFKGTADLNSVIELAQNGIGSDEYGFRHEFIQLVDLYRISNSRQ